MPKISFFRRINVLYAQEDHEKHLFFYINNNPFTLPTFLIPSKTIDSTCVHAMLFRHLWGFFFDYSVVSLHIISYVNKRVIFIFRKNGENNYNTVRKTRKPYAHFQGV